MAIGAGSGCVPLTDSDKGTAGVAGQQNPAPPWWAISAQWLIRMRCEQAGEAGGGLHG